MYTPREDSFLLEKWVKELVYGKVLEIGCGSGILIEAALTKTENVIGVDIDGESLEFCKSKGLNVKESDLFSNVEGKFDFIIFNPPYLPEEPFLEKNFHEKKDIDLVGGKEGWEIIERFFLEARGYLKSNGKVLILFSNLTNKEKVESIIKENNFQFKCLEEKSVGLMERLYIYLCDVVNN